MSFSVGIVAEGITDQLVIQNILLGHFRDRLGEQDIYFDQPPDLSSHGGWEILRDYLRQGRHRDAFQFRDYLVVQIDSDVSHQKHFDVPHADPKTGKQLTPAELVIRIRRRLVEWIGAEDILRYEGRFFFAVCVHELECWLVPLWEKQRHHAAVTNCARRVQQGQDRAKVRSPINKNEPRTYDEASSAFRKTKLLKQAAKAQASLGMFLEELVVVD